MVENSSSLTLAVQSSQEYDVNILGDVLKVVVLEQCLRDVFGLRLEFGMRDQQPPQDA